MKSFRGTSQYDDESKTYQSSNYEGIYTNDSSEGEVGLYALEAIPKVGTLFQVDQKIWSDDHQPTPCVLTEGEIVDWVNKNQLQPNLCPKERKQYEDLLCKYIHMFAFSYKGLKEILMEQHKIELLPNAKPVKTKQGRWNPRYITMVKEELDKLLEAWFIRLVETTTWVSPVVLALKKNGQLKVCVNYKTLNKVIQKDRYPLPFWEIFLEEIVGHMMYTFEDGYMGYH